MFPDLFVGIFCVIHNFMVIFTLCIKYASVSLQFLVILEFSVHRLPLCLVSLVFMFVYLLSPLLLSPYLFLCRLFFSFSVILSSVSLCSWSRRQLILCVFFYFSASSFFLVVYMFSSFRFLVPNFVFCISFEPLDLAIKLLFS